MAGPGRYRPVEAGAGEIAAGLERQRPLEQGVEAGPER